MSALAGIRVLDLSRLLPGGFCSLLLADFGADVIKVEDTGMGDYVRWASPQYPGAEPSAGGAMFLALNRGKRSVRIDLKTEGGREVMLRLARDADVLLESFRPGVMERLGVGWERLREENPRLVYCAVTGYGQDGPFAGRAGHDIDYLARIGLLGMTGDPEGPPVQAAGQIADLGGGALMAAFGILAALRERDRSGEGQLVDVSMADGALSWLAMDAARVLAGGETPGRGRAELAGGLLCYRPYRCADGWVALGALEPKFWRSWCEGVGRPDLVERQFDAVGSDTHREVEAVFAGRTRAGWEAFNDEHDCCLEPVLGLDEALESELVGAREMVVEVDQPGADAPVRLLGTPVKLSRTPADPRARRRPGPGGGHRGRARRGRVRTRRDPRADGGRRDRRPIRLRRRLVPVVRRAFFVALGDGRFAATPHTRGPWDPAPPARGPAGGSVGARARALRAARGDAARPTHVRDPAAGAGRRGGGRRARGPAGPLGAAARGRAGRGRRARHDRARVARQGGGRALGRRGWRAAGRPAEATPPPPLEGFGYGDAVELRFAAGSWFEPGPATVWTRLRVAVVEGEEPTGLQRVLAVADSGNGVSACSRSTAGCTSTPSSPSTSSASRRRVDLPRRRDRDRSGRRRPRYVRAQRRHGIVARGAQSLLVMPR